MNERLYNLVSMEKIASISSVKRYVNAKDDFVKNLMKTMRNINSSSMTPQAASELMTAKVTSSFDKLLRKTGVDIPEDKKKELLDKYLNGNGNPFSLISEVKDVYTAKMSYADRHAFDAGVTGKLFAKDMDRHRRAGRIADIDTKGMDEASLLDRLRDTERLESNLIGEKEGLSELTSRVQNMREHARDVKIKEMIGKDPSLKAEDLDNAMSKQYRNSRKGHARGGRTAAELIRNSMNPRIEDLSKNKKRINEALKGLKEAKDIPTTTPSVTPTPTPSAKPSATPSATPTPTPSVTPSATPSAKPTPTPSVTPSATPSATPVSASDLFSNDKVEKIKSSPSLKPTQEQIDESVRGKQISFSGGGSPGVSKPSDVKDKSNNKYMWPVLGGAAVAGGLGALSVHMLNKNKDKNNKHKGR